MAATLHDDLDELDEDPPLEIVVEDFPKKKGLPFSFSFASDFSIKDHLRKLMLAAVILALGGGLGGVIYLFTAFETKEVIGLLDFGESPPKLSMALPGLGDGGGKGSEAAKVAPAGSGLLTPPAPAGGGEMLKATSDNTPPVAASPDVAPPQAQGASDTPAAAAQPDTSDAAQDELAKLEAASARPTVKKSASSPSAAAPLPANATAQEVAAAIPTQPNPRSADKQQIPTFESLATPKAEFKPLAPAPIAEMQRKTQAGDLPFPAADGRQPWQAYARPWSGPADKGKVAVVVVDLGLDKAATEAAIAKLPPEVTLAFSPYAPSLDKWIKKARDFGHEVLMGLPAEGPGYPARDPGPYGLIAALSPEANLNRLETVMSKGPGYVGLISLGSAYGASPAMAATLAAVKEHGLMFVGDGAPEKGKAPPQATVTAVVDSDPFREAIDMRLNQVSIQARSRGVAVAVVNARPLSFHRLMAWINDLDGQNLVLTPASTAAQQAVAAGGGKS